MNQERQDWLGRPPQEQLAKRLGRVAWVLSTLVLGLVVMMQKIKLPLPEGWSTDWLPPVHAGINGVAALVLMVGGLAIRSGRVRLHRAAMVLAMVLSILFLLSYVAYHMTQDPTQFGGVGVERAIYFFLLITHIVAAAVSLPFILFTFIAAFTYRFEVHRKLARWVFPLWLYVAVTGPVCYWMLRPYYA
jgi:putative membrane protein